MDEGAQRPTVPWENGTLAPVDRLRSERADSPTPGLVEGTEPGEAGPYSALCVDCQCAVRQTCSVAAVSYESRQPVSVRGFRCTELVLPVNSHLQTRHSVGLRL